MKGWLKLATELGPLAMFFIVFTLLSPKEPPADLTPPSPGVSAESTVAASPSADAVKAAKAARLEAEIDALIGATVAFMIALVISIAVTYTLEKSVSKVAVFTAVIVLITGALTYLLRDEVFIKMKPTIAYGFFALALFFGVARGHSYLKDIMGDLAKMTDVGWLKLERNWALFFVFAAVLNEFIWRFFDTNTWVLAKTFVYVPLIVVFTMTQAPLMNTYALAEEGPEKA
ncbi:MAG: septation protein IspZ [Neomegalonema sp.]|nr:septation protein IspZ [Neomegalonema sp.]